MKRKTKTTSKLWEFGFVLEHPDFIEIKSEVPSELLEYILEWVERNGYQMGGGYHAIDNDDTEIKNFKVEDLF